jgi:RHH-type proline utilization regulon transcriptional repressor/proline dehydrogenase/delta 1-pyrroline-5-carboxylate dehydrogenase
VLHAGSDADLAALLDTLARRDGPIVQATSSNGAAIPLERLVIERSISINTAAAGGNASLMTIG